jgi:hypothetical protein
MIAVSSPGATLAPSATLHDGTQQRLLALSFLSA